MALEVALGTSLARVRTAQITRDLALAGPDGHAFCVVAPLSPPRLWSTVNEAVRRGFFPALQEQKGINGGLQRATGAAAQAISRLRGALVEPNLNLDAQLVGVVTQGEQVHLTISAGMRIYRARGGEPKRLLNNPQRTPGVSRGGMLLSTDRLLQGDLLVFGSRDAFGMRSIGAIATMLAQRPAARASELCEAALGPCRTAGIGVGLVVMRVG
ncbi:MAG: hypothetical protein JNK72_11435 [Myxococcales bacterium]|nr:hypothetical protein [Myxococcales bacterium]